MYEFKDAWKNGLLALEFSPLCIVVHGNDYGKAVLFETDTAHRGDIVGFPRAQLLLEAQSNLMAFLLRVVDLTLERANLENPSSFKWSKMCQEGFKASADIVGWSSYTNQPFSKPPPLDVEAVTSAAEVRLNATGERIALLQTDPAYTRRHIRTLL